MSGVPAVRERALPVFRRGVAANPELRVGLAFTILIGLTAAIGRIAAPVALQLIIDDTVARSGDGLAVDLSRVIVIAALTTAVMLVAALLGAVAKIRLVHTTESALWGLRTRAFAHVHSLSLADHVETDDGTFLARVTADVEAIARFIQWGLLAWTVNPTVVLCLFVVIGVYSWKLMLVALVAFVGAAPAMIFIQRRLLAAHDELRGATTEMFIETDELIAGAGVIRANEVRERMEQRAAGAIFRRYDAAIGRNRFHAWTSSVGDIFGALALAVVFAFAVWQRSSLGLSSGGLIAVLYLITLLVEPVGQIGEVTDSTQSAIAGWRKVLDLLDVPVEVREPENGRHLPSGPLGIALDSVTFAYRDGPVVLDDVTLTVPAGVNVAVVGETGSGKTTFAKLLCRLADPVAGTVALGGVTLDEVAPESRLAAVRMVPQDGFLFEGTVRDNVRLGGPCVDDEDMGVAVASLGLERWVDGLPEGLDTPVGQRGSGLSVGERQLVALIRAAVADPGLLILDEATSSVDPETDQALTRAITELSQGRTVVSIAHRLSTAEAADLVLVFDQGRLVEQGPHDELVAAGGRYAALHAAWVGNTRR